MNDEIIETLNAGGIVILRTDTIYGILARAASREAVEKVHRIKERFSHKPFILLLSDTSQAYGSQDLLQKHSEDFTDRPTSMIVPAPRAPQYLLRGGSDLAYRLEQAGILRDIIQKTGPLVAPSANPEGLPPARTIEQAQEYFGDLVDLYVDGGTVPEGVLASRIIRINPDTSVEVIRD